MKRTSMAIALAVLFASGPAFAFHCPVDMAAIDKALPTAELSPEDKAKVVELRQKGEELHKAGDHKGSVDTLAEAKAILGIK